MLRDEDKNSGMKNEIPFYRSFLIDELNKRMHKNPSYSLRAFSHSLGLSPGTLSALFNGKRPMSLKTAVKITEKIKCSEKVKTYFLTSVAHTQKERMLKRVDPKVKQFLFPKLKSPKALDVMIFELISEWYYAAILEMTFLEDFKNDESWIAKELDISVYKVRQAIERLLELGLLKKDNGSLVKINDHLEIQDSAGTSSARRNKQKQIRQKAIEAIDQRPVNERYMTTLTMAIDPQLLPEARKKIDDFNDALCEFLTKGKRKEIYTMEIGLFSLQKKS